MQRQAQENQFGLWQSTPTPEFSQESQIVIWEINKREEYVKILNTGAQGVNLDGWILRSDRGNQDCILRGQLGPGEILTIWAMEADKEKGGHNCGYDENIWNNSEPDPAILIDNYNQEVDRFPK